MMPKVPFYVPKPALSEDICQRVDNQCVCNDGAKGENIPTPPARQRAGGVKPKSVIRTFVYTFTVVHITFRPVSSDGQFRRTAGKKISEPFMTGFVTQMKGVKSAELLLVTPADVLNRLTKEVQALDSYGNVKSASSNKNKLYVIKMQGKDIAEIVLLKNKTKDDGQAVMAVI